MAFCRTSMVFAPACGTDCFTPGAVGRSRQVRGAEPDVRLAAVLGLDFQLLVSALPAFLNADSRGRLDGDHVVLPGLFVVAQDDADSPAVVGDVDGGDA